MQQIAQGLDYLHGQDPQIIHGDLRGVGALVMSTSFVAKNPRTIEQYTGGEEQSRNVWLAVN